MATSIRLAPEMEQRLDFLASQTGRTKAYYLREIIEQGLTVKHLDAKNISNSYLVTLDGYKFEISRALTQSAAYLIRRS